MIRKIQVEKEIDLCDICGEDFECKVKSEILFNRGLGNIFLKHTKAIFNTNDRDGTRLVFHPNCLEKHLLEKFSNNETTTTPKKNS